jgi:dienelactone hydrolase
VTNPATTVDDITFDGPDGEPVGAYLVRPAEPSPGGPAVLAWHWLDGQAPDGDRTEFLDEAATWAGHGITSLLPQLRHRPRHAAAGDPG